MFCPFCPSRPGLPGRVDAVTTSVNVGFVLFSGYLVFFM